MMVFVMSQGVQTQARKSLSQPCGDVAGETQKVGCSSEIFSLIATTTTAKQPKNLKRGAMEPGDSWGTGRPWPLSKRQLATWRGARLCLGTQPRGSTCRKARENPAGWGGMGQGEALQHLLLCSPHLASDPPGGCRARSLCELCALGFLFPFPATSWAHVPEARGVLHPLSPMSHGLPSSHGVLLKLL